MVRVITPLEELLAGLVATPSVTGSEHLAVTFCARRLVGFGLEVTWVWGNIAVYIRGRDSSRILCFNAHLDTVPVNWPDALTLGVTGDRLIGGGASDDKAGVAVLLTLAKYWAENQPPCDVVLTFVRSEETSGYGSEIVAAWLEENFPNQARAGLILEPTNNRLCMGHRGGGSFTARATGTAHHGSVNTSREVTAALRMARFEVWIRRIQQAWMVLFPDRIYGPPTINVTNRRSQTRTPNLVDAEECTTLDIRVNRPIVHHFGRIIRLFERIWGITIEWPGHKIEVVELPPDALILQAFKVVRPAESPMAFGAACDMNAFQHKGRRFMGVCGPGDPDTMHQPGEGLPRQAMEESFRLMLAVAAAFAELSLPS